MSPSLLIWDAPPTVTCASISILASGSGCTEIGIPVLLAKSDSASKEIIPVLPALSRPAAIRTSPLAVSISEFMFTSTSPTYSTTLSVPA